MHTICLATGNSKKVEELRAILEPAGVRVEGLADLERAGLGPFPEPVEDGETFEANAAIKAVAYARMTGRICLAEDSGLEVDALGGAPGVYSARYCEQPGPHRNAPGGAELPREERDRLNNERLLAELEGVPAEKRVARFVCAMALAVPGGVSGGKSASGGAGQVTAVDGDSGGVSGRSVAGDGSQAGAVVIAETRGTFEGRIGMLGEVPRGDGGFGYDPLFLLPEPEPRTSAELRPGEKNALSHRGQAARAMAVELRTMLGVAGDGADP